MTKYTIPDPYPTTKKCSVCGEEKPLEAFSPHPRHWLGRHAQCKACMNVKRRWRYALEREVLREQGRSLYERHSEDQRLRDKQRRAANKDKQHAHHVLRQAIKTGRLSPASDCLCFVCGKGRWQDPGIVMEYHHVSYDKPLEVFPVCSGCHHRWHLTDRNGDPDLQIVKEESTVYEYDSLDELYDVPGHCECRERTLL